MLYQRNESFFEKSISQTNVEMFDSPGLLGSSVCDGDVAEDAVRLDLPAFSLLVRNFCYCFY